MAEHDGEAKPPRKSGLHVRVIERADQFAELRTDWNALALRQEHTSVFLTHEWFDAAWQWRRQTAQLFLLCLCRDGQLAAIMPLVRERNDGHAGRILEFLTVPDTQFCDIIAPVDDRSAVASALVDELLSRRHEWDLLRLAYLPEGSVTASDFAHALALRNVRSTNTFASRNPYVPLDAPWDAYYATRSRSLKKASNLCANRVSKIGSVQVRWFSPATAERTAVDALIDDVTSISARSWKMRTANSLDHLGPQAFIRRLSHLASDSGWLSVWILSVDGKPLAMEYQLIAGKNVYALRSDFDSEYDAVSPGTHLNRVLLEQLCGRGLHRYYMGPGNNSYKFRWTELAVTVGELVAFSPTARGRIAAGWQLMIKPRLRRLRDRFASPGAHEPEPTNDD